MTKHRSTRNRSTRNRFARLAVATAAASAALISLGGPADASIVRSEPGVVYLHNEIIAVDIPGKAYPSLTTSVDQTHRNGGTVTVRSDVALRAGRGCTSVGTADVACPFTGTPMIIIMVRNS